MEKKRAGLQFVRKARSAVRRLDLWLSYQHDAHSFGFRTSDIKARVKKIGGGYRGSNAEWCEVKRFQV